MRLTIDTSDRKKIQLRINGKSFEETARVGSSQKLLAFIKNVLDKEGTDISELEEIDVNTGPGSFTGLRVGVSVAQSLGWGLGIKVNNKDLEKGEVISISYKQI